MKQNTFMLKTLITSLFALLSLTTSLTVQAIQFELGGSLSTVVTRVSDTSESNSNSEAIAVIATKASFVPYFSLVGKENYFGENTSFGWTYQIWGSSFTVDQQETDGEFNDDYGTELQGKYLYVLPQIYYRWGDRFSAKPTRGWKVTVGMGYGISYVELEGDLRLSKTASEENAEIIEIDTADTYYSFGIFAKASFSKVFFSVANNLPQLRDDDNDLLFRIHNISYTVGYEFVFDFEIEDLFN